MCTAQDKATLPFVRFGLTKTRFEALREIHDSQNEELPRTRSCDEMPFFDWEADKLQKVFEQFKEDDVTCGLIAAMMQLVQDDVLRKRAEKAAKLIPKPVRANTVGMFFPPPEEKAAV